MKLRSRFAPGYEIWGRLNLYGPLAGNAGPRGRPGALAAGRARRGHATQLPFPDASFDGAISTYGLTAIADVSAALDEMVRVVRPGGRVVIADVHFVNWPAPPAVNRAVTAALRPFNTWYADRDIPALLAARGLGVTAVETHRPALSLTIAQR